MPEIQAFRGLRYNLAQVGSLSNCIAPPYDVVDRQLQDHLYNFRRSTFLRLELNRAEKPTPTITPFINEPLESKKLEERWGIAG